MNRLFYKGLLLMLILLQGCGGDDNNGPDIKSLELSLSKSRIVADGEDFAKAAVFNQTGADVTDYVSVYVNDESITENKIISAIPSSLNVYAKYENIKSNEEVVEAVEDKNLKFKKNVLIEQYTGTWCGWCPRAINQIIVLEKTDPGIVHIAYHLSDEYAYQYNTGLFQSFGFTGIPTVHADRIKEWQGEMAVISEMHLPSRTGISLEVTGNSSNVMADVNVKFGYDFTNSINLSVFLLHDSLVANQANYYNTDETSIYYNAGNPMVNFTHRNVMIMAGTDMFGDVIPFSSIDIGSTFNKKVTFTSIPNIDLKRMIVVAFVSVSSGPQAGEVLNCVKARMGQKVEMVYDEDR